MSFLRVQFTIRRLMIGVAILASVLGAGSETIRLKRFRALYLATADAHAKVEQHVRNLERSTWHFAAREAQRATLSRFHGSADDSRWNAAKTRDLAIRYAQIAAYHSELVKKYRRAAERPWWSVEPDGPEPNSAE